MLRQQIERAIDGITTLNFPRTYRIARGRDLNQLERVRRHTHDGGYAARRMSGPTGALQQSRHALGAADLHHQIDRGKVHAEVERRRCHDGAKPPALEPVLDGLPLLLVERTVVNRDRLEPLRARSND